MRTGRNSIVLQSKGCEKCQSLIIHRQTRFDFLPCPSWIPSIPAAVSQIHTLLFIRRTSSGSRFICSSSTRARSVTKGTRTHFGSLLSMAECWLVQEGHRDDAKKGNNEIIGDTFSLFLFIGNTIIRNRPQDDDDGASRLNPRSHRHSHSARPASP